MPPDAAPVAELGSLALDFLHTLRPTRHGVVDLLLTPTDLLTWLAAHPECRVGPEVRASVGVPAARSLLDEARRLRADIGALVASHAGGQQPHDLALFGVNRVLAASRWSWHLAALPEGIALDGRDMGELPISLLGPIALAAARLVTDADPSRLRTCASTRCGAWFVDTSKGGRRRWCSMARCGNREKAAAHRAKGRST